MITTQQPVSASYESGTMYIPEFVTTKPGRQVTHNSSVAHGIMLIVRVGDVCQIRAALPQTASTTMQVEEPFTLELTWQNNKRLVAA